MTDYELICDITLEMGEDAIDSMILDATKSQIKATFNSTYSTTQIAMEIDSIKTAVKLNKLLKKMKILLSNGDLNPSLIDKSFFIKFNCSNKKGERYSYIRWTKEGRQFILTKINDYILEKNSTLNDKNIKYIIQEAMKAHGGNAEYDDDIYLDDYIGDLTIRKDDVLNFIKKYTDETNGETNGRCFFFRFLGRGVRYCYDASYEKHNENYIGTIAIYETEGISILSNGPLKQTEFVSITSIEVEINEDDFAYDGSVSFHCCIINNTTHYYELTHQFYSKSAAYKFAEKVQQRGTINLIHWIRKSSQPYIDYEAEESSMVQARIDADTLPDDNVPGFRD